MTHALYLFAHGAHADCELRYSLRSLEQAAPWVGKVWIFGDRPQWLADDKSRVEHVPHEYMARLGRWKTPLKNHFLMTFLASLVPGLTEEFLALSDDFILLAPVAQDDLCRVRVLEDLAQVKNRGKGLFKEALWRTYDTLKRLGYGGLNFECHVPRLLKRRWLWEAYCEFQDFVTEDRFYGLLCETTVMNYVLKHEPLTDLVWLNAEGRKAGFYNEPPTLDQVRQACTGKTFFNFDDKAWGPAIEQFLREKFPEPSMFERADSPPTRNIATASIPPQPGSQGE